MTPEFKAAWLADLRNPATRQCTNWLQTPKGNCCLGRALVVTGETAEFKNGAWRFGWASRMLWEGQLVRIGITYDVAVELAQMNDQGKTFPQIANWIEANIQTTPHTSKLPE